MNRKLEPLRGKKHPLEPDAKILTGLYVFDADDVKSASKGLYQEFTNNILETSDLDPINIVRYFGDLQMKWFKDVLDPNVKS